MKAVQIDQFGPPSVLSYRDVETPHPSPDGVVIKVHACGVNRLDHYLREGTVLPELGFPHVLGSDAVGEISAIGENVTGFEIGDRVIPMPGFPLAMEDADFRPMSSAPSYAINGILAWGAYAEYMHVPARWVVRAPALSISNEELATLPMVLVTGVRAVRSVGGVKGDDHVLVHAGTSGTGSMNVQIAKALGAKVATTVDSPEKVAFASELGADLVIDVSTSDFVEKCLAWTSGRGVDVVIDNLGGRVLPNSIAATRNGGTIVTMGFVDGVDVGFNVRSFFFGQKRLLGTLMGDLDDLRWGLDLVSQGRVRAKVGKVLRLSEARHAHELIASNTVLGNIVMVP